MDSAIGGGREKPRLKDVALRAGVSVTTVSHAFTNQRPVAPATKERIWRAALELDFTPPQARKTLALLLRPPEALPASQFGTVSFSHLVGAAAVTAMSRGYFIVTARDVHDVAGGVPRLDGCLMFAPNYHDECLQWLQRTNIPVVSYDPDPGDANFNWWAGADYAPSITKLMVHLLDRSARRIAVIVGQTNNTYRRALLSTYASVMRSAGLSPMIRMADNAGGQNAALEVASELLTRRERPDAILTTSSVFATGVLTAATAASLSVPKDLKIATVTDGPLAEFADPPITGLRINAMKTAATMIDLLEKRLRDENPPAVNPRIELDLISRGST